MFNYRSKAILKREIKQQIFSRKFLIMTISMPVVMAIIFGLQFFIATFDKEEKSSLHIINESAGFQNLVKQQIADSDLNNAELYQLQYLLLDAADLTAYVDEQRPALLNGQLTGVVFIPDSARDDKNISYYSTNPANQILQTRMREVVNKALVGEYFDELNIDPVAIEYARTNVSVEGIRVSKEGNSDLNTGNLIIAFGSTFLIYISLLSMGPTVMAAVNEEKTSRVVEVLLSAVTPQELMYGKIMGTAMAGLAQMLIWISPMLILSLISLPALVMLNTLSFDISLFHIVYFLCNYLMGLLIFLSIFAAFGAMFDTPQDAQSSMMPVMMLIIIPFLMVFTMARNPANTVAEITSMLPFATILVMPARMTLIDVPLWQLGVAFMVNLLTIYYSIRFGAKIYRVTILMTGKRPGWKEIYKWIRYS